MRTRLLFTLLLMPVLDAASAVRSVCNTGCTYSDLQTAINASAQYQDNTTCEQVVLTLQAGETYTGAFTVPAKACRKYVNIRSSRLAELTPGVRVSPSDTAKMPKIISPPGSTDPTLVTADGSGTGYWAFEGLEITQPDLGLTTKYSLMQIGVTSAAENRADKTPHHFLIDRSYLHGVPFREGPVRCLALHARNMIVTNSYISECKSGNTDAQGIWMGQSLGPVLIINNYIEGSTENFLTGGGNGVGNSEMSLQGHAQRDLRFIGNHFRKKPEWRRTSAAGVPARVCMVGEYQLDTTASQWYVCSAAPSTWSVSGITPPSFSVKNIFELKDGQGVYVYGNTFEKVWESGQYGPAFVINQSGGYTPNYNVRDVHVIANKIQEVNSGFGFGNLNYLASPPGNTLTRQVRIEHNLFTLVAAPYVNTNALTARFLTTHKNESVVFRHNTVYNYPGYGSNGLIGSNEDDNPSLRGFNYIGDNILDSTFTGYFYGFSGGLASHCWWRNVVTGFGGVSDMRKNVFTTPGSLGDTCSGGSGPTFPADTVQIGAITSVLEDPAGGNFRVQAASAAKGTATDGLDMGVDVDLVDWATAGSVNGQNNPFLAFRIRGQRATATTVTLWISAPGTEACTVTASSNQSLTPADGSVTIVRTGRSVRADVTGLLNDRIYYYRVTCGGWYTGGVLRTAP